MTYYYTVVDNKAKVLQLNNYKQLFSLAPELAKLDFSVDVICGTWWTLEQLRHIPNVLYLMTKIKLKYNNINVHFACNTKRELENLTSLGITAFYCNQNCFVDEDIYKVYPNVKTKYDAIYNARLSEWKRHSLCKEIDKVAFISYGFDNSEYKAHLDDIMGDAYWYNCKEDGGIKFLDDKEVAIALNESSVGLALSPKEGAMYASMEYLMCGLPVVSTQSIGGRDVFFDNYNSMIVNSDPDSVKKGVEEFIARDYDPHLIREHTLEMVNKHRSYFIDYINKIIHRKGYKHDISDSWNEWFIHKLRHEGDSEDVIRELI